MSTSFEPSQSNVWDTTWAASAVVTVLLALFVGFIGLYWVPSLTKTTYVVLNHEVVGGKVFTVVETVPGPLSGGRKASIWRTDDPRMAGFRSGTVFEYKFRGGEELIRVTIPISD